MIPNHLLVLVEQIKRSCQKSLYSLRQEEALAVDNFVQCARKRVRYITLCEPHDDNGKERAKPLEDISRTDNF